MASPAPTPAFGPIFQTIEDVLAKFGEGLVSLTATIGQFALDVGSAIPTAVAALAETIGAFVSGVGGAIPAAVSAIVSLTETVGAFVLGVGGAVPAAVSGIISLAETIGSFVKGIGGVLPAVVTGFAALVGAIPRVTQALVSLGGTVVAFGQRVAVASASAGAAGGNALATAGAGLQSVLGGLGKFAQGLGAASAAVPVIGAVAGVFTGLVSGIQEAIGSIGKFVQAISPSTMLAFSLAMQDLSATIGSAFVGMIQIVTSAVREIGGILLPVMQKLTPVINTLANAFATYLTAGVRVVAAVLEGLAPVIAVVADMMNLLAQFMSDTMGIVTAAIKTVTTVLQSLLGGFGGAITDVYKQYLDILRQVVKALVTFLSTLAVFAGFRDTVRMFGEAIAKEAKDREARAGGLKAAASNPAISDILSIGKQQQQAGFIAAGGDGMRDKTDTDWLKAIAGDIAKIAGSDNTLEKALDEWWNNHVLVGRFGEWLRNNDAVRGGLRGFLLGGMR